MGRQDGGETRWRGDKTEGRTWWGREEDWYSLEEQAARYHHGSGEENLPSPQDHLQGNIDQTDKRGGSRRRGWFSFEGGDSPSSFSSASSSSTFFFSLSLPAPQPPNPCAHSEFHLIGAEIKTTGCHSTGWKNGVPTKGSCAIREGGKDTPPGGGFRPLSTYTVLMWNFMA